MCTIFCRRSCAIYTAAPVPSLYARKRAYPRSLSSLRGGRRQTRHAPPRKTASSAVFAPPPPPEGAFFAPFCPVQPPPRRLTPAFSRLNTPPFPAEPRRPGSFSRLPPGFLPRLRRQTRPGVHRNPAFCPVFPPRTPAFAPFLPWSRPFCPRQAAPPPFRAPRPPPGTPPAARPATRRRPRRGTLRRFAVEKCVGAQGGLEPWLYPQETAAPSRVKFREIGGPGYSAPERKKNRPVEGGKEDL